MSDNFTNIIKRKYKKLHMNYSSKATLESIKSVQQLTDKITTQSRDQLSQNLQICQKIVSEVLKDQRISVCSSQKKLKLLLYELILLFIEHSSKGKLSQLSGQSVQSVYRSNLMCRQLAEISNLLSSMKQFCDEMDMNNNVCSKTTKKGFNQDNLSQSRQQFSKYKSKLFQFLMETQNKVKFFSDSSKLGQKRQQSSSEQEDLIFEQMQQIIAKKEKRIQDLHRNCESSLQEILNQKKLIESLTLEVNRKNQILANKQLQSLQINGNIQQLNYNIENLNSEKQKLLSKIQAFQNQNIKYTLYDGPNKLKHGQAKTQDSISSIKLVHYSTQSINELPQKDSDTFRTFIKFPPKIQKQEKKYSCINEQALRILLCQAACIENLL